VSRPDPRPRRGPDTGPDGLTERQRSRIEAEVAAYFTRMKPAKPMVAVRNLSPAFLELAIALDVALCEMRDAYGRERLIAWGLYRNGIPGAVFDADGHEVSHPGLHRVWTDARKTWDRCIALIDKIERTPVVGGGDRTLKARARDLRGCNFLRQLDWLHSAWWYDTRAAWEARQEREG